MSIAGGNFPNIFYIFYGKMSTNWEIFWEIVESFFPDVLISSLVISEIKIVSLFSTISLSTVVLKTNEFKKHLIWEIWLAEIK